MSSGMGDLLDLGVAFRLLLKSRPASESGCREWMGALNRGYGVLNVRGKNVYAHRAVCHIIHGPSPDGKPDALHSCNNRGCIAPAHLRWGDDSDNAADRAAAGTARGGRYKATHCIHGHEFTEENIYRDPRGWGRACKECARRRVREFRERKLVSA